MEFSEHQWLFLAAACKHFHETGTWPTYGSIDTGSFESRCGQRQSSTQAGSGDRRP